MFFEHQSQARVPKKPRLALKLCTGGENEALEMARIREASVEFSSIGAYDCKSLPTVGTGSWMVVSKAVLLLGWKHSIK